MSLTLLIAFVGRTVPIEGYPGFVIAEADGTVLALTAAPDPAAQVHCDSTFTQAHFKTMLYVQGDKFHESGRIDFPGTDSYLIVSTTEAGTATDETDGTITASMIWHVTAGGGQFKGARGRITGNSRAGADGQFTDHQVYKIRLPDQSQ